MAEFTEQEVITLSDDDVTSNLTSEGDASTGTSSDLSSGISLGRNTVLNELVELIEFANRSEPSPRIRFPDGVSFIESIHAKFDDYETILAEKDQQISALTLENETLKKTVAEKVRELSKLEERRRSGRRLGSFERLRQNCANLQGFFAQLVMKLEREPVNAEDSACAQKQKEFAIFKVEVSDLFHKVEGKLRNWRKNQKDMEEELEKTKFALERLNQMVDVKQNFRALNADKTVVILGQTTSTPLPSSTVISSGDGSSGDPALPPPPSLDFNAEKPSRKRKLPPPPLLPLMNPPETGCTDMNSSTAFQAGTPYETTTSVTSSSVILPTVNATVSVTTGSVEASSSAVLSNTNAIQLPPLPSLNFPLSHAESLVSESNVHNSPIFVQSSTSRVAPTMCTQSGSDYSDAGATKKARHLKPELSVDKMNPPLLPFYSKSTTVPPLSNNVPATSTTVSKVVFTTALPPTHIHHVIHPTLPQSQDDPIQQATTREVNEGLPNGQSAQQQPPTVCQNVCGLCKMKFHTLVQLRLHHTVMHGNRVQPSPPIVVTPAPTPLENVPVPLALIPQAQVLYWNNKNLTQFPGNQHQ